MKNIVKTGLIIILFAVLIFVGYKIFTKKEEKREEKLVLNNDTVIIDMGDIQLLVNDSIVTNVIYLNYTGCYLFCDQKIIDEDISDVFLTIASILRNYDRLSELTVYENSGTTSAVLDTLLENKEYPVELTIYTSVVLLQQKIVDLNLSETANIEDKVELVTLFYNNSNIIKKEVKEELEKEKMTYSEMRSYMLRESDDIKTILEDGQEVKIIKKLGEIETKNRIYYCYDISSAGKSDCFIYDIVDDEKKQIFINTELMRINYSSYIDYEVTYNTNTIDGIMNCQKQDGEWISIYKYVKGTNLEFYPEYLECITKKNSE